MFPVRQQSGHAEQEVARLTYERSQLAQIAILLYLGYITTENEVEVYKHKAGTMKITYKAQELI